MNTAEYLARIACVGKDEPTEENLFALQYAHLTSVPYENLDILLGKRISLEPEALFDKIVRRRRGGYCFELNKLFGLLLSELGYGVKNCVARYHRGESAMPKRRHQVLLVTLPGSGREYLCDVGVGAVIPLWPVPFRTDVSCIQRDCEYSVVTAGELGFMLREKHQGEWRGVYSFTDERQQDVDFVFPSFWCEFAPESPFNKQYMLSIRSEGRRVTLDGFTLREFTASGVSERLLDDDGRDRALAEIFGIDLSL